MSEWRGRLVRFCLLTAPRMASPVFCASRAAAPSGRQRLCGSPAAPSPCLFGHGRAKAHQIGDKVHIGLEACQEFRLQEHALQPQPLKCVFLDDLHHRRREELADIAEPARDARRRTAQPAALLAAFVPAAVERGQRGVDALVAFGQSAILLVGAKRQPPAPLPFNLVRRAAHQVIPNMVLISGSAFQSARAFPDHHLRRRRQARVRLDPAG